MPRRKSSKKQSRLSKFKKKLFRATGISLGNFGKGAAFIAIALIGIYVTVFYTNARDASDVSGIEDVEPVKLTTEELLIKLTKMPARFSSMRTIEKIDVFRSKVKVGEELVESEGGLAERAVDPLIEFYGALCFLQEEQGIDPEKDYMKLATYRQQAAGLGNVGSVASADFFRALAATHRLYRRTERADFHFAADAVLNLDSEKLNGLERINTLYSTAIKLHDTSSKQESTAKFLSVLGEIISAAPNPKISNLGLNLKDHARFSQFHAAVESKPYTTRESKLQFFRDMFEEIEKAPARSLRIYQTALVLIDRLLNKSEGFFAGTLMKRIRKASSHVSPNIKPLVDEAIGNVEIRLNTLGKAVDLSGSDFRGSPLQLPKANPTVLLFCTTSNKKSMEYVKSIAQSDRYNPWSTNFLVASTSPQSAEELEKIAQQFSPFIVLDNGTSSRLAKAFAIDRIPYQVAFDKDRVVIRLGAPID